MKKSPAISHSQSLDGWTAFLAKVEPRFPQLVKKAATRRGLASILRLRFQTQLNDLQPSKRKSWIDRRVARLLRKDLADRVRILFIRAPERGDKAGTISLVDEQGRLLQDLFRPMVPTIALKGFGPDTVVPITLPLPQIQRQIRDFVRSYRTLLNIRVPPGQKPGDHGVTGSFLLLLLAYLTDLCHLRKADLLRLVDRDISTQNYCWLARRLVVGRRLLAVDSEVVTRVKALGMDSARWYVQVLVRRDPDPQ
jgi:hypothetical protein